MLKRLVFILMLFCALGSCIISPPVSAQNEATLSIENVDRTVAVYEGNKVTYLSLNTFATADVVLSTTAALNNVAVRVSIPDGVILEADINGTWTEIRNGEFFGSSSGFDVPANYRNVTKVRIKLTRAGSFTTRMDLIQVNDPDHPIYSRETILVAPFSSYVINLSDSYKANVGEELDVNFNIKANNVGVSGYDNAALRFDIQPSFGFSLFTNGSEMTERSIQLSPSHNQDFLLRTVPLQKGDYILRIGLVDQDSGQQLASGETRITVQEIADQDEENGQIESGGQEPDTPKTGDEMPIAQIFMVFIGSILLMLVGLRVRNRK